MTSEEQKGIGSDRIRGSSAVNVDLLECPICHGLLWIPIACQRCETSFCSACINRWLAANPRKCPNRCKIYIERKCPSFIVKLLAQLQLACYYQSRGCERVIPYEALETHESECDYQPQQCPGCRLEVLKKDFDNHTSGCAAIELTCQECKLVYKRVDAATTHTENICLREQIKENIRQIRQLTLQLHEMRLLLPSITKARITFNDLPMADEKSNFIPDMYRGLEWNNIYYIQRLHLEKNLLKNVHVPSLTASNSPHVALFSGKASISAENVNGIFTFISLTVYGAWNDNMQLLITGHRNSILVSKYTTVVLWCKPQLILLNWRDIDKVILQPLRGTRHPENGATIGKCNRVSQLLDLPDEVLLMICRYLQPVDVLRAFFKSTSDRLHSLILDYRTNLVLSALSYAEFRLVADELLPYLETSQLTLSNSNIPCLVEHFLSLCHQLPLNNLRKLTLNSCTNISSSFVVWLSNQSKLEDLNVYNGDLEVGAHVMKSGLMFNHFADLLREMIKLQHLYVRIYETTDTSFARFSLVENLLPNNVVEFHYAVSFSVPLSTNIETELASSNSTRFKVKRSDSLLYTVPWSWNALHLCVPPTDYQQIYQRTVKSITIRPLNITDEAMVRQLQPWLNVTEVIAKTKLPSLAMFRHLKTLKTSDADVVRTSMPLTLRSLKITDKNPLALNAPFSTVVHGQVHKLNLFRSLHDEQELLNVLHQFPNLRFLSIVLPSRNSKECLMNIFDVDNVGLSHLVCLQARNGDAHLWKEAPFEWLITYTHLKYRSNPFHVNFSERKGLIVWL
ncbi:unnamed protein product [Rotaria magnacalcarata]|uniref:Uncharacterized protein n=3 Tax=Rotaria magnacalcarata TaxID=392030 RepID=A0A819T2Z9_9BILA|nr:unnamed protein product [Rotaria magnacalcarata]